MMVFLPGVIGLRLCINLHQSFNFLPQPALFVHQTLLSKLNRSKTPVLPSYLPWIHRSEEFSDTKCCVWCPTDQSKAFFRAKVLNLWPMVLYEGFSQHGVSILFNVNPNYSAPSSVAADTCLTPSELSKPLSCEVLNFCGQLSLDSGLPQMNSK